MTRETKIGLLVGLAFIIVIGILLEDHFSSVAEPKPAPLSVAGQNVRTGYGSPGSASNGQGVLQNPQIEPRAAVPSPAELNRQNEVVRQNPAPPQQPQRDDQGYSDVRVGPGGNDLPRQQVRELPTRDSQRDVQPPTTPNAPRNNGQVAQTPGSVDAQLAEWARRHGEPVEPVAIPGRIDNRDPADAGTAREFKAESGDDLARVTQKYMGSSSKANREAFIKANPEVAAHPKNWIVAGHTYVIPDSIPATPAPTAPTPTPGNRPGPTAIAPPPLTPAPGATNESWYTTKTGDSLWKIATEQCGNGSAVAAIKQLNPDKFPNNTDVVQPNVKLRLPAKQVASGN